MRVLHDRHTAVCLSVLVALPADGDGIAGDSFCGNSTQHNRQEKNAKWLLWCVYAAMDGIHLGTRTVDTLYGGIPHHVSL